ncbi:MAG: hypothetical protein UR66_C0009G0038 [Candidatus Moranbacteria bacterium GW2011_GWE1_35_17]|nr:MAG: hypothetical protein UR66_C0009G0038 [Candidatus Moranbacteria bacterium GW2011_GWE1_35_17]KKP68151.1 MAG: hypothetical protein UR65_C0062G0007 [Candidatus Moranbacteria bacterium GW2011_GWE2_35_164]KKP82720.1 MAG: hypothetical protein UR82_C0034G0016 [Candidatus Moranbacteria bacterium GW2011_GWF1_35_5]KKP84058.1 MAG: hypothetical protein UR83_C0028G0014 [Candidatus Moranbacteria bacterium GW2011_GWF2_35_54]
MKRIILLVAITLAVACKSADATGYTVVEISSNSKDNVYALNNNGWVTISTVLGYMQSEMSLWVNGSRMKIGVAGFGTNSPRHLNDYNEVAGDYGTGQPFFYMPGRGIFTIPRSGNFTGLNNSGFATMFSSLKVMESSAYNLRDNMELPFPANRRGLFSTVHLEDISNTNVLAGYMVTKEKSGVSENAFVFYKQKFIYLKGGKGAKALFINDNNWVVGTANGKIMLWRSFYKNPIIIANGLPLGINNRNQVFGYGWIWENETMVPSINILSDIPGYSNYTECGIVDINDRGQILAKVSDNAGGIKSILVKPKEGLSLPSKSAVFQALVRK